MSKPYPFSIDDYKELSYDLYPSMILRYYWLSSDFDTCYRFMPFFENNVEKKGRLQVIHSSAPEVQSYEQTYSMVFNDNDRKLFITLNEDKLLVETVRIFYGTVTAMILNVVSTSGSRTCFYAAASHPFSSVYKKIYDK